MLVVGRFEPGRYYQQGLFHQPLPNDFEPQQEGQPSTASPFGVHAHSVYTKLSLLNATETSDADDIPAWILKENANLLADPVSNILNYSFSEARLPPFLEVSW